VMRLDGVGAVGAEQVRRGGELSGDGTVCGYGVLGDEGAARIASGQLPSPGNATGGRSTL